MAAQDCVVAVVGPRPWGRSMNVVLDSQLSTCYCFLDVMMSVDDQLWPWSPLTSLIYSSLARAFYFFGL